MRITIACLDSDLIAVGVAYRGLTLADLVSDRREAWRWIRSECERLVLTASGPSLKEVWESKVLGDQG